MYDNNMNMVGQMGQYDTTYQMQQNYGYQMPRMDSSGFIHYTKGQIIDGLKNYVVINTGVPIDDIVKIDETPSQLRHACIRKGIIRLSPYIFNVPEINFSMQFYFCPCCRRLYYPIDIIV